MGDEKQNDPDSLRQSGNDLGDIGGRMESTWQGLKDEYGIFRGAGRL